MAQATKSPEQAGELQRLKGIGKVLAQRLRDTGITTCQEVVEAGEEGLSKIAGLRPQTLTSILNQAKLLAEEKKAAKAERVEAMRMRIASLKEQVERLAELSRERFAEELEGRAGKKLSAELKGVVEALERMHGSALKRLKRAGRGLDKAERRMAGFEEAGLRQVRKRLKKSRKALLKALI